MYGADLPSSQYTGVLQGYEKPGATDSLKMRQLTRCACICANTPVGSLPTLTKMRVRVGKVKGKKSNDFDFSSCLAKQFPK
jgi:hypothetical protein